MRAERRLLVAAIALVLAAACTGLQASSGSVSSTTAGPSISAGASLSKASSGRDKFALKNAENVGVIRVIEPSGGDNVEALRPVFLAAYKKACRDVQSVESEFRSNKSSTFIVVRCGDGARTRAVRVIYTAVRIPDLIGDDAHGLNELAAMFQLHLVVTTRQVPGARNKVVNQEPPAGTVVPFGSTLTVTIVQ